MTRWILSFLLLGFAAIVIVSNLLAGRRALREKSVYSSVPVVGGFAGAVAILICPLSLSPWWILPPLLLDFTISSLIWLMISGRVGR